MRLQSKLLVFALVASVLSTTSLFGQINGTDPGLRDSVVVDSTMSTSSTQGFVPVYVFTDEELGGIEITLTQNSPDLVIDSFSFIGSVFSTSFSRQWQVELGAIKVGILSFGLDPIPPSDGLVGNLFFSYAQGIQAQLVNIDTTTITVGDRISTTFFTDLTATNPFRPSVMPGYLDIQPSSSGCCLGDRGNVDGSPDDAIDISDLLYMVDYQFNDGPPPPCVAEANIDGSLDEQVDIADLLFLVDYQFMPGSPPPASCP